MKTKSNLTNFNSTMVRLGDILKQKEDSYCVISIPLWCGWEQGESNCNIPRVRFQFHYGAVGSPNKSASKGVFFDFNSTMVRLGAWKTIN